jgi:uncharacterized membrane protein
MLKFLNQLSVVMGMLGLLSWVAAHALIRLPFVLNDWWSTFIGCFVVIWLLLDNVSLCAEINALRAVAVSVEDSNKALVTQLEHLEKRFVQMNQAAARVEEAQRRELRRVHWNLMADKARALFYIAGSWKIKHQQGMRRWGSSEW